MNAQLTGVVALAALLFGFGCEESIPFHYAKHGRVIDSSTQQGLVGIEVACMIEKRDCDDDCHCESCGCDCEIKYEEHTKTYSARDGYFYVPYDEPCILFLKDIDDDRNAGRFDERRVEFCSDDSELVVELTRLTSTCVAVDHSCGG
jgi:hypothetical protein